jgi:hypothetical protein
VQVSGRTGLLARCGEPAASCCRHVDISTAVHRVVAPSTPSPLLPHGRSPGSVGGDGARVVLTSSFSGVARRPPRSAPGFASDPARTARLSRRRVDVTSRDLSGTGPSPDCAHSWGQLLDESTPNLLVTVSRRRSSEVNALSTGLSSAVEKSTPRTRTVSPAVRTVGDPHRAEAARPRERGVLLLAGAALDAGGQLRHLRVGGAALAHQVGDLLDRVHDGGVVLAAEGRTDAR